MPTIRKPVKWDKDPTRDLASFKKRFGHLSPAQQQRVRQLLHRRALEVVARERSAKLDKVIERESKIRSGPWPTKKIAHLNYPVIGAVPAGRFGYKRELEASKPRVIQLSNRTVTAPTYEKSVQFSHESLQRLAKQLIFRSTNQKVLFSDISAAQQQKVMGTAMRFFVRYWTRSQPTAPSTVVQKSMRRILAHFQQELEKNPKQFWRRGPGWLLEQLPLLPRSQERRLNHLFIQSEKKKLSAQEQQEFEALENQLGRQDEELQTFRTDLKAFVDRFRESAQKGRI